jgi:hypothetical protein
MANRLCVYVFKKKLNENNYTKRNRLKGNI